MSPLLVVLWAHFADYCVVDDFGCAKVPFLAPLGEDEKIREQKPYRSRMRSQYSIAEGFGMLQAQLRGKLTREEENLEDLLTSNVFGSFKYLPPEDGLLPLLASSVDSNGNALPFDLQPISRERVKYDFWPWIQESTGEGCEPDVIITLELLNDEKIIILIEAKYLSGKSSEASDESEAPKDQLAREWENLSRLAERKKAIPVLLYVTAHLSYPSKSIEDSRRELALKRKESMRLFWISWRKLPKLYSNTKQDILSDLVKVLRRQGLTFFEGITTHYLPDITWSFKGLVNWNWSSYDRFDVGWKYRSTAILNWQYKIEPTKWRFGD